MEGRYIEHTRRAIAAAWRLAWPVVRQALGWLFLLLGLIGLALPVVPQVPFLVIGVMLVGRRHPLIRRATLLLKRFLRRWARVQTPVIGALGRAALQAQWECSRQTRRLHRRYDAWVRARSERRARRLDTSAEQSRYERKSERV